MRYKYIYFQFSVELEILKKTSSFYQKNKIVFFQVKYIHQNNSHSQPHSMTMMEVIKGLTFELSMFYFSFWKNFLIIDLDLMNVLMQIKGISNSSVFFLTDSTKKNRWVVWFSHSFKFKFTFNMNNRLFLVSRKYYQVSRNGVH